MTSRNLAALAPQHPTADLASHAHARRLLWLAFGICALTLTVGRVWDSYWHTIHLYEGFFSPPHIFIYAMTSANIAVVAVMLLTGNVRRWFGPGFKILGLPFEIPNALALVLGAFAFIALAGLVLDNWWHWRYGLDETVWALPHSMLGWMWLAALLGFVACYLASGRHQAPSQYTSLIISVVLLGFSVSPILGPLYQKNTPAMIMAIARIPVLMTQPSAVHLHQIYLQWNLDRTNPLVAPLGAFWAGAALAFVQQLDRRTRVMLGAAVLWTLITALGDYGLAQRLEAYYPVLNDPASWLPLPLLPAAMVYAGLRRLGFGERTAWAASGATLGLP